MASYDSSRGCYVVRVVYDGPGFAGKTTNLKRVCELIPATRRSEMYTPASLKGRTMFFDWMEIDGPKQGPNTLKFQLITVPGQIERNYRRRPLVEMADVIVFVCDSSPEQVPDTMRTFARLRTSMKLRERPVPLVVQANKQDVDGALRPASLKKKLGLTDDDALVSASAATGKGVQETLRMAVRLGVRTLAGTPVEPLAASFANAEALFDHVLTFEDNPQNDEPVEVEEVDVRAEHVELDDAAMAAHLAASSFDSLEARARRAAQRAGKEAESR
ncbi:MAG TPA: ADP-ribosylation factor-like protein, partial [Polyangiaceae bacterium]